MQMQMLFQSVDDFRIVTVRQITKTKQMHGLELLQKICDKTELK